MLGRATGARELTVLKSFNLLTFQRPEMEKLGARGVALSLSRAPGLGLWLLEVAATAQVVGPPPPTCKPGLSSWPQNLAWAIAGRCSHTRSDPAGGSSNRVTKSLLDLRAQAPSPNYGPVHGLPAHTGTQTKGEVGRTDRAPGRNDESRQERPEPNLPEATAEASGSGNYHCAANTLSATFNNQRAADPRYRAVGGRPTQPFPGSCVTSSPAKR